MCVQNRTEARRVMQGKNPPQNCIQAFSKEGDQIFTNRSYTAEQTRANYLTGDVEEEIRCLLDSYYSTPGYIWSPGPSPPDLLVLKCLLEEITSVS